MASALVDGCDTVCTRPCHDFLTCGQRQQCQVTSAIQLNQDDLILQKACICKILQPAAAPAHPRVTNVCRRKNRRNVDQLQGLWLLQRPYPGCSPICAADSEATNVRPGPATVCMASIHWNGSRDKLSSWWLVAAALAELSQLTICKKAQ